MNYFLNGFNDLNSLEIKLFSNISSLNPIFAKVFNCKEIIPLTLTKFTSIYFIFVGILIAIIAVLPNIFPEKQILVKNFWVIFGFMAGITYIAYMLVDIGIKRDPEVGVMAIMGSIAVKMIFCMAFVLDYSIKAKGNGLLFALNFFSVYLLFTAFEIYCLLRNLRHQNLK